MSYHGQLVLALGFAALMALGAITFFAWMMRQLISELIDYCMERYKRWRNAKRRLECRVGRPYRGRLS